MAAPVTTSLRQRVRTRLLVRAAPGGDRHIRELEYSSAPPKAIAEWLGQSAVGYHVERGAVPPALIEGALRCLNLEIMRRGVTPDQIREGAASTFFPHLRWEPPIMALRDVVEDHVLAAPAEEWAEPQLLVRFPDEALAWPLEPHVDEPPTWADGRQYRVVVGVPLTSSMRRDGCLVVWPGSHTGRGRDPEHVELCPGDLVFMDPRLQHCATLNRGGTVRFAVYFRLLFSTVNFGG